MDARKTRRGLLAGAAAAALAGCLGGDDRDIESETYGDWFRNADFAGTVDRTGESEVRVTVGAEGNGGNRAYDPAAVRVTPGTTVVWEWTGAGGAHNVVEEDRAFESDLRSEAGFVFRHTFEQPGTYRYVCTPHQANGMKGAVDVVAAEG